MRKALLTPSYCACCYGQKPEVQHIDFEASYDGPVVEVAKGVKMAVDDLILCEDCVGSAARLLGYSNEQELREENDQLGNLVEYWEAESRKKDSLIHEQNQANNQLLDLNVKRPPGRPKKINIQAKV